MAKNETLDEYPFSESKKMIFPMFKTMGTRYLYDVKSNSKSVKQVQHSRNSNSKTHSKILAL